MIKLISDEIILRPLQINDASAMAQMADNKNIWDNLRDLMPHPYSLQDAWNFISRCEQEDPVVTFAIEYHDNFAGVIGLIPQTDIYRLTAELGYWIGEAWWNKGIATRAVKLIVQYGFEQLGLMRIYSGVFEHNKASQRVLEKADFKLEAVFKNAFIKNDKIGNECRYAIIR